MWLVRCVAQFVCRLDFIDRFFVFREGESLLMVRSFFVFCFAFFCLCVLAFARFVMSLTSRDQSREARLKLHILHMFQSNRGAEHCVYALPAVSSN